MPYLIRNLKYWSDVYVSIIVLDGSNSSNEIIIKELFPNVEYYHLPISMEQRIFFVGQKLKTSYVMISADDDFMLKSGVSSCIKFLDLNHDYVAAFGTAATIESLENKIYLRKSYDNLIRVGQITHNSPWKRFRYHFKNNNFETSILYSIQRVSNFRNAALTFQGMKKLDGNMFELLLESAVSYSGKTKVIDELTWIRTKDAEPNWTTLNVVGEWTIKFANSDRKQFIRLLDIHVLSKFSNLPSVIRISLYKLILIDKHLFDLTKIRSNFKWMFYPLLFIYINFNLRQLKILKQIKPRISVKILSLIKPVNFNNHNFDSFSLNTQQATEISKIFELINN